MKLFGRFHEMSINQVCLYRTPIDKIEAIMVKHPEMQVTVKEYIPKKGVKEKTYEVYNHATSKMEMKTDKLIFHPDYSKRHQVSLVEDLGFMKITLYSEPLGSEDLSLMGLKPIASAKKKEKMEKALMKLDPETAYERQSFVESVEIKPSAKKSKKR